MAYTESDREILKEIGSKIRNIRKTKGLSQMELSFKAELDRTYIGSVERGERNIAVINLHKIAKALEVNVSDFFE